MKRRPDYWGEMPKMKRLSKIEQAVWKGFSMQSMMGQRILKGRFNPKNDRQILTPNRSYIRRLRKKRKKGFYERFVLRVPKTRE